MKMAEDQMKNSFKYYKQRKSSPDFTEVLDFNKASCYEQVTDYALSQSIDFPPVAGLHDVGKWKAYSLKSMPGFVFITNPFQNGSQLYWVQRCLHDYHVKPSKTNLDIHRTIGEHDNLWDLSLVGDKTAAKEDEHVVSGEQTQSESDDSAAQPNPMYRLRWTTVGHHHDWNTQRYSRDNFSPVPVDLAYLVSYIAATLGYPDYRTEAGIINFYHMDSYICGHTDHSEEDKEAPLISVSFGQTAIFLVGGLTKEDKPVAMYLRSGDIVVMMGPSRLRYHAVPRIMPDDQHNAQRCLQRNEGETHESDNEKEELDNGLSDHVEAAGKVSSLEAGCKLCFAQDHTSMQCKEGRWRDHVSAINTRIKDTTKQIHRSDWLPYKTHMQSCRINMNARQVYEGKQRSDVCVTVDA